MSFKWIILLSIPFLICSCQALNYDQFTIRLNDDTLNSANFTIDYTLSEREQNLLKFASKETLDEMKPIIGLNEDHKTGTITFTGYDEYYRAESNGSPVLLFDGFYFDQLDWRTDTPFVKANSEFFKPISQNPLRGLITPDFQPNRFTLIWPNGVEFTVENKTYIPNLMQRL